MSGNQSSAWRCVVCGYVHRGPEPPEECMVCGSPQKHFEPYSEPGPAETKPTEKFTRWRCLVCNYEESSDHPPEPCPVCGAPAERFEGIGASKDKKQEDTGPAQEIVIVGSGIAGISALEAIRQISTKAKITVLSKEAHFPYYRLNLTRFLAGELNEDKLPIYTENWYEENGAQLIQGAEVASISPDKQEIALSDARTFSYDKLILTAGAHPFVPPIPGTRLQGVTTLRSLNDARFILQEAKTAKSIVVIGGGVLGLETAGALARRSKNVTLLENFKWLMPRQLNQTAAELLKKQVEGLGISLKVDVQAQELLGDESVAGVLLKNGETLPADLVIITAGVRSNSYLARLAGLNVNRGILVNDFMQTSHPSVYAAGDIAEHRGVIYGLWNAAQFQGSIAGMNAAGKIVEFSGIPRSNSIKVLGVDLLSIGKFNAEDGSDIIIEEEEQGIYRRFIFRDSHLVGSILYGDTAVSGGVKKAIENNDDCSGLLKKQPTAPEVCNYFAENQ